MNKTWQDSLRMCLQLIGRIQMTYNTMPGSLCNMLMTETRDLINLLPAEYSTSKKYLAEDLARLPDGCFLNAYAYGRLQRDLQYLGVALENPTAPNPLGKTSVKSAKKIFISHSSKDKTIVPKRKGRMKRPFLFGAGNGKSNILATRGASRTERTAYFR